MVGPGVGVEVHNPYFQSFSSATSSRDIHPRVCLPGRSNLASPRTHVSSSSLKDSSNDVFKNLFFPNLIYPPLSKRSGVNKPSVGPVVPSGVCVLPGPSRESSEEYDTRVRIFREKMELRADARGSRDHSVGISFSSINSQAERWRTSDPFLAGALFSLEINNPSCDYLQLALLEAEKLWFRSFDNEPVFEGISYPGGRRRSQGVQTALVSSSVATMTFQLEEFSFPQNSNNSQEQNDPQQEIPRDDPPNQGDPPPQDAPQQPFQFFESRLETMAWGLNRLGFSREVSDRICGSCRPSTLKQYQSSWKGFLDFLRLRDIPHGEVSIPVICEYLNYCCIVYEREYRTISVYKCALRLPLLWAIDLDFEGLIPTTLMKGIFNFNPPLKAKEMPKWSLDLVLNYLTGDMFEPLEDINDSLLTQKTLFLVLLASGRRNGEITNLSRVFKEVENSQLELIWVKGFRPKHYTPEFQPKNPSISRLFSNRPLDNSLCPVRAYFEYLNRSKMWWQRDLNAPFHHFLWTVPSSTIQASSNLVLKLIQDLIGNALRDAGKEKVEVGVHQIRKLAASHSFKAGHNIDVIKDKMGFSEIKILKKNYIAKVPDLSIACVLPGGTFFPNVPHSPSDSD